MSSTDNHQIISDDSSCKPIPQIGRIPLRKFSDTSSTESEESGRSLESDSDVTSNSERNSIKEDGSSLHSDESEAHWSSVRPPGKRRATKQGRRSLRQNRVKRKKGRRKESDGSSSSIKLHYKNYHTHFHRRANYGKFSLIRVIRYWVIRMSQFGSKYHKEIFLVLFCIVSGLVSLRTSPIKTKTVPKPSPFFNEDRSDLVEDLFGGEYVELTRKQIPFNPAFILYYAHWDSESFNSRSEFLSVARHFRIQNPGSGVKFYAINCWWPDGQCKQYFRSMSHYPIFVAHAASTSGVIYNGPIRAGPMIKFLDTVLKPFTRIDTDEELWRFRAQHDAIMLTNFNSTQNEFDPSFNMYRQMALRNLEADPFSQVGFGLFIRKELGEKFYLSTANTISLVLFNEIHTAKWIAPDKGMKGPVGQVADWVTERAAKTPITWSYQVRNGFASKPVALGASDLSQELSNRPLFLLVTRRYYPSAYSPFYALLKEVALDYFNCNKSLNVTKLRRITHKLNAEWMRLWKSITKMCKTGERLDEKCKEMWEELQHWEDRKEKLINESLKNYEWISNSLNFTGLSCKAKKPLRFVAIDPVDIPYFTKLALGLRPVNPYANNFSSNETFVSQNGNPVMECMKDPVAFIIDAEDEALLQIHTFNISEIARTIHNFTLEVENRTFNFPSSHFKDTTLENLQSRSRPNSTIKMFNSEELMKFLGSESSTPLLLMYSAPFCAFCSVTLAQFTRLGEFLKEYEINLILAKIDTFKSTLPLHMTPEKIPAFLYFPPENRSESRVLTTTEPITAKVLLKFLLSQLDADTRVRLSLHKTTKVKESIRKNKRKIGKRIETILEALVLDPSLKTFHEENGQMDLVLDFTPKAVDGWRNELLQHLRNVEVRLDAK